MNRARLAKSISYFFDPSVVWLVMDLLILFGGNLTSVQFSVILLPFVLLEMAVPFGSFLFLLRIGWISDWEITNIKERHLFFVITMISHAGSVAVLFLFASPVIAGLRLLVWIIQLLGTLITFYWKISIHLGSYVGLIFFIMVLYGGQWWWLFLGVPPLMWARVERKKHTWTQTVGGVLLPVVGYGIYWLIR